MKDQPKPTTEQILRRYLLITQVHQQHLKAIGGKR